MGLKKDKKLDKSSPKLAERVGRPTGFVVASPTGSSSDPNGGSPNFPRGKGDPIRDIEVGLGKHPKGSGFVIANPPAREGGRSGKAKRNSRQLRPKIAEAVAYTQWG